MNDDVLVSILDRLEKKVDRLSIGLTANTVVTRTNSNMLVDMKQEIKDIKFETKRTNGRVTSLENTQLSLAEVSTQNSGIIVDIQERLKKEEERGQRDGVVINRLLKNENEISILNIKEKEIEADTRAKIKVGVWSAVIGGIGLGIAGFFNYIFK